MGPRNVAQFLCGPYCFDNIDLKCSMLTTNKTPSGSYRGPGRFEADFIRERLIDLVAKELDIDRREIRRRNLVADSQMPYRLPFITPSGDGRCDHHGSAIAGSTSCRTVRAS
jgi:carbon-monoxide dehydrogenase large subunit